MLFKFLTGKVFFINLALALLLVVGVVYYVLNFLDKYTLHGQSVSVPGLSGIKIEDLDKFFAGKPIQYTINDSVYDNRKHRGVVVDQNPPEGAQVKEERKIYLTVNAKLPLQVPLPDLKDVTLRQAIAVLESFGIPVSNKRYVPDQCFNCVLWAESGNHKLEAGALVIKGHSVDLVLGQGKNNELLQVPDLFGLTTSEVNSLLSSIALNYLEVSCEGCNTKTDSSAARVFRQSPVRQEHPAGSGQFTMINAGSSINIWLTCDKQKLAAPVKDTLNKDAFAK